MSKSLESIRYYDNKFEVLNQLLLPQTFVYEDCSTSDLGFAAIKSMKVRGAPAIAIAAALSLASELKNLNKKLNLVDTKNYIFSKLDYLCESRPTAVNLFKMTEDMKSLMQKELIHLENNITGGEILKNLFIKKAEELLQNDISDNMAIGHFGAECFSKKEKVKILTHCNTGSLATAGYGTALGIIRTLHAQKKLERTFACETRPYNQGARLTAFELVYEKIPATLISDSMASFLMKEKGIDGVIVGADRVVANGDTANKIGTYQLAIAAHYHNIPFYVAAPTTSIDCKKKSGKEIMIEERPKKELTHINNMQIAADGIDVWNPSFDVTPAFLISGIVTEIGVIFKNEIGEYDVADFLNKKKKATSLF
ncbi:S-methyl-5-thioribose-1-phosphate isomerase [Fluviispira sanaruensis]|uniref:Methylthioribose-1-phosphate isomerase n=1 Tax=Fluviispira sanaruensis TaxID=2493639 RepID=A0A4P2VK37_FLUSA|nr:S-methyl-5-thioribose-1-phosphate isomerase [Fluviispira sanaruensis]BBH52254.1 S-methyl-5-thioribose-1-phosphate isomerase [Fluviispira sanaruensis]